MRAQGLLEVIDCSMKILGERNVKISYSVKHWKMGLGLSHESLIARPGLYLRQMIALMDKCLT